MKNALSYLFIVILLVCTTVSGVSGQVQNWTKVDSVDLFPVQPNLSNLENIEIIQKGLVFRDYKGVVGTYNFANGFSTLQFSSTTALDRSSDRFFMTDTTSNPAGDYYFLVTINPFTGIYDTLWHSGQHPISLFTPQTDSFTVCNVNYADESSSNWFWNFQTNAMAPAIGIAPYTANLDDIVEARTIGLGKDTLVLLDQDMVLHFLPTNVGGAFNTSMLNLTLNTTINFTDPLGFDVRAVSNGYELTIADRAGLHLVVIAYDGISWHVIQAMSFPFPVILPSDYDVDFADYDTDGDIDVLWSKTPLVYVTEVTPNSLNYHYLSGITDGWGAKFTDFNGMGELEVAAVIGEEVVEIWSMDQAVSTTTQLSTNNIQLYPNPVQSGQSVTLKCGPGDKIFDVRISDIYGKLVMCSHTNNVTEAITIATNCLSAGTYYVSAQTQGGNLITQTLIVF